MIADPKDWKTINEARVPVTELSRLALLRDRCDVRVRMSEGIAWVRWVESRDDVVRVLLPSRDVIFFRQEGGRRYRFGCRLPTEEMPPNCDDKPLDAALIPTPIRPLPPDANEGSSLGVQLLRGGNLRPVSALLCLLNELKAWADEATTFELASLTGLMTADRAVVFGSALPTIPNAVRLHGSGVMLPVGFRLEPDLPDELIRAAAEAAPGEVLIFTESGWDRVPRDRAEPLTRAGIRLAQAEVHAP